MQLTVKLKTNKCYHHKNSWKLNMKKTVLEIIFLFGLLNYLSNKVIQIKSFFYSNLLRQLFFPTNIGNYIKSQTNLSFIYQNFISEFFLSYYIFLLLECTTICMQNFLIKKGRSLKISILPQHNNKSCKVLIQEEKTIRNSSKTISSASLSNNYFQIYLLEV